MTSTWWVWPGQPKKQTVSPPYHSSQQPSLACLGPPTSPPGLLLTTEPKCANPSTHPAPWDSPALSPCVELPEEPAVPVCLPAAQQEEGQEERKEEEGQERGKKEQVQQEITRSSPRRTKRIRKSTQLAPGMIYYY